MSHPENESPAETIRRAIEQMRALERGAEARPKWVRADAYERGIEWIHPVEDEDGAVCEVIRGDTTGAADSCDRLAAFIASWSPGPAAATGDLLEVLVDYIERARRAGNRPFDVERAALRLARTYLGETP